MFLCVVGLLVIINELADAKLLFEIIIQRISDERHFYRNDNEKATTGHKLTRTMKKPITSSYAKGGN